MVKERLEVLVDSMAEAQNIPRAMTPLIGLFVSFAKTKISQTDEVQLRDSIVKLRDEIAPRVLEWLLQEEAPAPEPEMLEEVAAMALPTNGRSAQRG